MRQGSKQFTQRSQAAPVALLPCAHTQVSIKREERLQSGTLRTLILTSSSNCSNPGTHTDQPWLISTLEKWHQTLPTQGGHCSHQTTFHCILLHPNTPGPLRTARHSALIFPSNHRAKKIGPQARIQPSSCAAFEQFFPW